MTNEDIALESLLRARPLLLILIIIGSIVIVYDTALSIFQTLRLMVSYSYLYHNDLFLSALSHHISLTPPSSYQAAISANNTNLTWIHDFHNYSHS